jgi:ferric-dicitrate binding protein FerR (iron transport regulator)
MSDSAANIHAPGSSITVLGDSLVQFEGTSLKVEHGGVSVSTSKGVATTAGDVRVAPVSNAWTEFNVTDVDGTVRIAARKGDLTVTDDDGTVTLAQGQETTRDEQSDQGDKKKKDKRRADGAVPAAGGGVLDSPIVIGVGAAVIIGVTTWVLLQSSNPVSASAP